jgi:hypothetical protein
MRGSPPCSNWNSLISVLVLVFMGTFTRLESSEEDPELGAWVLNPTKSTYDPGPALKSQRRTVDKAGDGQRVRNETATTDGMHAVVGYTAKFDGKDYPVAGSPYGDTVVLERLDSHTVKAIVKKGGKLVLTDTRVVSNDGNVLTITQVGMSPNGQPMHNLLVYDRSTVNFQPAAVQSPVTAQRRSMFAQSLKWVCRNR